MGTFKSLGQEIGSLNKELLILPLKDVSIHDIVDGYCVDFKERPTFISNAFSNLRKEGRCICSSDDVEVIKEALSKKELHAILRGCLAYLAFKSTNDMFFLEELSNACDSFSRTVIGAYDEGGFGRPLFSLETMLLWLKGASPRLFHEKKVLIAKLITDKPPLSRLFLIVYFIDNFGDDFFSKGVFQKAVDDIDKIDIDKGNVEIVFQDYKRFLESKTVSSDKALSKQVKRALCVFSKTNLSLFTQHFKQIELQNVLVWDSELKGVLSEKDNVEIRESLKQANAQALSELQSVSFPLYSKEKEKDVNKFIEYQKRQYGCLDPMKAVYRFFADLPLFSKDKIKRDIERQKEHFLLSCIPTQYLDKNGRVINYRDLTDDELFSLEAHEHISTQLELHRLFYLSPFFLSFKGGDELKKGLTELLEKCQLIDPKEAAEKAALFARFFEEKYTESVISIILDFERDLRYFFENQRLNVYRKNNPDDPLSLDSLLSDKESNKFKEKLLETIDEDYFFTLRYFLTDKYGLHLRDEISHGASASLSQSLAAVYICAAIIRLYLGFVTELKA